MVLVWKRRERPIPRKDEEHCKMGWLQLAFVGVSLFDLIFFSYYLFTYELKTESMISDTLFARGDYATLLTVTLAIRLLGGVLFLLRYRVEHAWWVTCGLGSECLTLAGWYWLVLHKDNANHFTGVGIFCVGSVVYSSVFIRLAWISHWHLRNLHQALMIFLLSSTVVLVISFVSIWADEQEKGEHGEILYDGEDPRLKAYIVEHAAYITHLLFYLGFFSFHNPNPNISPLMCGEYEAEMSLADDPYSQDVSACQPLIRLPTIAEHV
jgi:hypothetical protein